MLTNIKYREQGKTIKNYKGKDQVTCKGRYIRIIPNFSIVTLKVRSACKDRCPAESKRPHMPVMITIPKKTFNTIDGKNEIVHNKVKFKEHISTNSTL